MYFHTNSLAILANMSNSLQDIHPYVSQRLVTLFDIVARRYQKLVNKQTQLDENIDKVRSESLERKPGWFMLPLLLSVLMSFPDNI